MMRIMRSPRPFLKTLTLTLFRPFSSSTSSNIAVKKVTRSNFDSSLSDLRSWIRDSDFVAIDLEMSGVTSAPWRELFEFDRSDVRYLKLKDSVEKFAIVQVGVCPFRWDSAKGSFVAHPHNFYVFPRMELQTQSDDSAYEFLCQTTSVTFLARHQFDFNAWIHEGISYLSRAQEVEARQSSSSAYEEYELSSSRSEECIQIPIVSTSDLLFTERMKIKFQEWRDAILRCPDEVCPLGRNPNDTKMQFQTVFYKMRPAILLNEFSSRQLKLIRLVLKKNFKDLVYVHANVENTVVQKMVVYTDSEPDRLSLMKEVNNDIKSSSQAKIQSVVGFRHVIDVLSSERKLIVGHNCFLDIAHICHKFIGPLPSSIHDFAMYVHKEFPYIIDTRNLINASAIQNLMKKSSKSLSSAFSLLCPKISSASESSASNSYVSVEVEIDDTGETGLSSWNSGAKHEAGYDAFMTGCVFAQACRHLGIKFETDSIIIDFRKNDKLQSYINLLYPSWKSGQVINLSTGIETPELSYKHKYPTIVFSNIVLVWGFPSKLKPKDLKDCVSKVFGKDSITSVFFLDSTAAFVQFSKEEFVNDFLILKDLLERDDDAIAVLHPLAKLLEGGNTRAASYDTYKDICGASVSKVLFADQADEIGIKWKTKLNTGSTETEERRSAVLDSHLITDAEQNHEGKVDQQRCQNQISSEDILSCLSGAKLLHGRRLRST